ncbi:hypothetical protein PQU92_08550 [Asticcacaulis sp. BYS171W]|uniref:Inner membrane protein n=1 Tax=Asticcacaulis aquaticus TaxID=2984212 RepID=A0ABT5HTD6_9CAUL|nr:hypothetical protein [Asticcacaulis aquaticus]MDC7683323.1 hypothetical protein [Asticcacaulis aquaticus]
MTDDLSLNGSTVTDTEKTKWARGPLIIAFAFPVVFVVLALLALGYGLYKDKTKQDLNKGVAAYFEPAPSAKDAEIARLTAELNALKSQPAPVPVETPATAATAPVYSDPNLASRLSERMDRLEANQRLLVQAAASATAAAGLQQAAKGSQPFLSELADVEKSLTDTSLLAPLRPLAQKGVPSEVSLAIEFPAYAARAQTAAKSTDDDSFLGRIGNALNGLISVRRVDGTAKGTDNLLLQAQGRLDEGDLAGALAVLATLPKPAQDALAPWLARARNRLLVDTTTRRITVDALSRLSQANYTTVNTGTAL